jgi:hypothetical protein
MNIIENDYNEIVAMNERLTQTILKFNVSKIKWWKKFGIWSRKATNLQ